MPRNSLTACAIVVVIAIFVSQAAAETNLLTLTYNPFSRPDTLKRKPQQAAKVVPPKQIELVLSAIMASKNAPMVIVNGEMLGIGEKIGQMELIAVLEGRAIFARGGKKYTVTMDK